MWSPHWLGATGRTTGCAGRRGSLEEAEYRHQKIKSDFAGKFSETHPDYLAAGARVAAARAAIAQYESDQSAKQAAATSSAASQQQETAASTATVAPSTTEPTPEPVEAEAAGPLDSLVVRELKTVVEFLESAEKVLDPALQMDSGPAGRVAKATPLLEDAEWKLNSIRQNYSGKFSEDHPDFAAVVDRLAADRAALEAFSGDNSKALLATATYEALSYDERNAVDRMREVARRPLADYEKDYEFLTTVLEGKVAADNPILVEMNEIIAEQRQWVAEAPAREAAQKAEEGAALSAKHGAIVEAVRAQFKDWGPVNALHGAHVGQIVWSRDTTQKVVQTDDAKLLDERFSLVDPLYATAFLARSLGNTAVWSPHTGEPRENFDFSYTLRLFIDDREIGTGALGFYRGELDPDNGKVVTVLPFTPNPVPIETGFVEEAEDWRQGDGRLGIGRAPDPRRALGRAACAIFQ